MKPLRPQTRPQKPPRQRAGEIRPAASIEDAESEMSGWLIVPEWHAGEAAADVAAALLREAHRIEPEAAPLTWALYTAAAQRLGLNGCVPVPVLAGPVAVA